MTDDDLAELIALDWGLDPTDRDNLESVKGTLHFKHQQLRMELDELSHHLDIEWAKAPRPVRALVRGVQRLGRWVAGVTEP